MKASEVKVGEAYGWARSPKYDKPRKAVVLAVGFDGPRPADVPAYRDDRPRAGGWSSKDRTSGVLVDMEDGKRLVAPRQLVATWAECEAETAARRKADAEAQAKRRAGAAIARELVEALRRFGIEARAQSAYGNETEVVLDAEAQRALTAQLEELSARRQRDSVPDPLDEAFNSGDGVYRP